MKTHIALLLLAALMLSLAAAPVLAQGVQNVELHGYMQNRFYANPDSPARFVTERVSLSAVGQLGTDATGYVEVYYHPWLTDRVISPPNVTPFTADQFRVYLESAYVDLPAGPGRLRIGKGRQLNFGLTPSYPNRKTSQYGILAETFTQDRIIGAQFDYKGANNFDIGATLYSDLRLENRKIGDFAGNQVNSLTNTHTVSHIVDKDDPANNPGMLAGSLRFGITKPNYQVHLSGAVGQLVADDVITLNNAFFGAPNVSKSTDHTKYGIDSSYTYGPYVLQAEAYQGNFSFLTVTGYQVLVGYQPKDKTRFYARWSAINNDHSPTNSQLSWSPNQFTVGIIQPIRKGVWVEVDYEKNDEGNGGRAKPKNDMLFAEFFTGF